MNNAIPASTPNRKRSAFTLLELLTVTAVIVILLGLLFPVIQRVQGESFKAKCISNLRQIGTALFSYAADNSGKLPPVSSNWPPANEKDTWGYAIWTYAGYREAAYSAGVFDLRLRPQAQGDNIFRCPANRKGFTPTPLSGDPVNANKASYGLNPRPVGEQTKPIPLSSVATPSRAAMVMECSFYLGDPYAYFHYFGLIPHDNGSNVLFYDGHIEYMKFDQIPKSDVGEGRLFWNGR